MSLRYSPAPLILASSLAQAADSAARAAALFDGLVFFGILFALVIFSVVMRVRDSRLGLSDEARKMRLKRRLPLVLGGLFAACFYIVMRV